MQSENNYTETDLGNIAPNPRGAFSEAVEYEYLDLVEFQGGSYLCLAELGTTIVGFSPEPGKNTEYWQVLTLPGGLTPDYIAMHDSVVNKAKQVEVDRAAVELAQQEIEAGKVNVEKMHQETIAASQNAEESKNQAAGYAQGAESSRQAAAESEQNAAAQVQGFDTHVAKKTTQAEQDIETARIAANKAIVAQQEKAIEEVGKKADEYLQNATGTTSEEIKAGLQIYFDGEKAEVTTIKDAAVAAKNTAIENANIAVNKAEETESDKQSTEANKAATQADKEATEANLKQSEWFLQEQASMLGKVPMFYAVMTLEELQAIPNAKENDFGIIQEPYAMLFRYITHDVEERVIEPTWVWMTDLNIRFSKESLLNIMQLSDIALSGSYNDLKDIPKRYNTPLVLAGTGETVEWDYSQSDTAVVTLTDSKPLSITGAYNGAVAAIQCYGGVLEFDDAVYNKAATLDFLEPLEAEHITYTLIYNARKWDVTALIYAGGEPDE